MSNSDDRTLSAIRACALEHGLRLAPRQPTMTQCILGARAGGVPPKVARAVYLAMLDADDPAETEIGFLGL